MPSAPRFRPGMTLAERALLTAQLDAERRGMTVPDAAALAAAGAPAPPAADPSAPSRSSPEATSSRRHCWVLGLPGLPGRWPGLLVEWARSGDVWRGRVVYVVDDDGQAVLVESWVPADQLQPR